MTQSLDNFTPQGMEGHQILINTEVMKHFRIMNRASVREIMLQHEKIFKEQVHDLHKLYEVQRLLMEKAKTRAVDGYTGAPPPPPLPPLGCGNALPEETNQLGQTKNFWEHTTPDSMGGTIGGMATHPEKGFLEKKTKLEVTSKCSSSPVRKRKIDLEQLPEDDSEDEMETSTDALNSSVSGTLREFTHGHSGSESMIKSHPGQCPSTDLKPLQPVKESQANSLLTGESSLFKSCIGGSGPASSYPSQHGTAPSLPVNNVKAEQNLSSNGEINVSFQNSSLMNISVGTIKSNTSFLPRADLIDRASPEAGRDAHWFFQGAEGNAVNRASKSQLPQQQRLSSHVAVPELSTGVSLPHDGVLQGSPHLEQRHQNSPSPPLGNISIGDWSKAPVEKLPSGSLVGAQKDWPVHTSERLGDASRWLAKEPLAQGPLGSVVPMPRIETRDGEAGPAIPSVVAPVITVSSSKALSQEPDLNVWSSQNPILQHSQFQQPSIYQSQFFPSMNRAVWLQPSQTTQNSMYSQHMVYGIHSSDSLSYRNDSIQRIQGEIGGAWNMVGPGHYYSSVPMTPQKPPFKKPPKLILKNDGVGMELKLVSPKKEVNEKASQKRPSNSIQRDPPLDISKSREKKIAVQKDIKDEDQKLDKRAPLALQVSSSVGQGREHSVTHLEPKLLATDTPSLTQEIDLLKESSLRDYANDTVALSSIMQSNVGTMQCMFAAGVIVSASPDKHKSQPNVSQVEIILPPRGQEKQILPSAEITRAACVNVSVPLIDHGIDMDMPDQKAESDLLQCKEDIGAGHCIMKDQKLLSAKLLTSEANAKDMDATSQPESLSVAPEDTPSKFWEEDVPAAANPIQKGEQGSDANHFKEAECPKGSHSTPCAGADSPSKDASHPKGLLQGGSVGHSMELANPSYQSTIQAVSIQSKPSATPSDRECSSAHSLSPFIPETELEAKAGASSDDLHLDLDNDNLAASILLSFTPTIDFPDEEKHVKGDASAIYRDRSADQASSNSRKERPMDQASSKPSQDATGLRTRSLSSGGSQCQRIQGQGSFKKTDRMSHHEPMKSTNKNKLRTEDQNIDELETDNGGEDARKGLTIRLPRVMGTSNGEAIPISRSKQLSKLNGVTPSGDSGDHTRTFKANDTLHTPTGRRSSRGPPMTARILHESGSKVQHQTRHRLDGCAHMMEKDPGSREEAAGMRNKAEGNMKRKAWGELNKTRSHLRKYSQDTSHRITQR